MKKNFRHSGCPNKCNSFPLLVGEIKWKSYGSKKNSAIRRFRYSQVLLCTKKDQKSFWLALCRFVDDFVEHLLKWNDATSYVLLISGTTKKESTIWLFWNNSHLILATICYSNFWSIFLMASANQKIPLIICCRLDPEDLWWGRINSRTAWKLMQKMRHSACSTSRWC